MTNKGKVLAAVIAVVAVLAGGVGLYLKGGDLMGKIFKVVPTLNVSLHASTPNVSILVAGEQFQPVASFKLVAGSEDLTIDSLSINCTGGDGALGSADNNIVSVKVFGGDVNKTSYLTNGVASFTGLKLFIPKDSDVVLNVNVDLNTIPNGATSGEYFHFSVGNIKAVGVASAMSATVKKTGI